MTQSPEIEKVKIVKNTERTVELKRNVVLFVLEGKLNLVFRNFPRFQVQKGEIMFLPASDTYVYKAVSTTFVIVFRLNGPIHLCSGFNLENLYKNKPGCSSQHIPHTKNYSILPITPRIWHYLDGLTEDLEAGVRCRSYFDLQIKKFFMLVRFHYTKDEIHDFFYYTLSEDTAFAEAVRLNWRDYDTVEELAASMNMNKKQFSKKFKDTFGTTPYHWMIKGRVSLIIGQINEGRKFSDIAFEHNFTSTQEFSRFVKKYTGKTPSQIKKNSI